MRLRNIIIAILLLLLAGAEITVTGQDRNVIWIHGLGDDTTFWNNYEELFQEERQLASSNNNYHSFRGIRNVTQQVIDSTRGLRGARTIAIGHSLGGVVTRELDRRGRQIGGAIVFGAPLDGARIVNSFQDGSLERMTRRAAEILIKGPKADNVSPLMRIGTRAFTGRGVSEIVLDAVDDQLRANTFNSQSGQDLAENSAYMRGIRTFSSNTPKIIVYGNENSPVHYRLASSGDTDGRNDTKIVKDIDRLKAFYLAYYGFNKNKAIALGLAGGQIYHRKARLWKEGYDQLNKHTEADWKNLIGATRTETYTYKTKVTYTCADCELVEPHVRRPCPETECWREVTRTIRRQINEPSDGLIHKSSQIGSRSSWGGVVVEAKGVNHMEMGNHRETETILRTAWEGGYDPIFRTNPR